MTPITTAVLLVAGSGTRLGDRDGRPKSLVDVDGKSLLARSLSHLSTVGVTRIVLATGYREEALRDATRDLPFEFSFCKNSDYQTTQNSVSLLRCREALETANGAEGFYKLDGDVLYQSEVLRRMALAYDGSTVTVAVDEAARLAEEEMKIRSGDTCIEAFGKGLTPEESKGETLGIEAVPASANGPLFRALATAYEQGRTDLYYEDVYNDLIDDGIAFRPVWVGDLRWTEIDTPEDLARARHLCRAFDNVTRPVTGGSVPESRLPTLALVSAFPQSAVDPDETLAGLSLLLRSVLRLQRCGAKRIVVFGSKETEISDPRLTVPVSFVVGTSYRELLEYAASQSEPMVVTSAQVVAQPRVFDILLRERFDEDLVIAHEKGPLRLTPESAQRLSERAQEFPGLAEILGTTPARRLEAPGWVHSVDTSRGATSRVSRPL